MDIVKVRKIRKDARFPKRATNYAVGYDIFASRVLDRRTKRAKSSLPVTVSPEEAVLVGTGVQIAIPENWQCEVRPRSGLASKYDIELSNSPGTIDPDFRGEAGVLLRNRNKKSPFIIEKDMRIAQLVFSEVKIPILRRVEKLSSTIRGSGGFGSTGLFGIREGTIEYQKKIEGADIAYMRVVKSLADLPEQKGRACVIVKNGNIISTSFTIAVSNETSPEELSIANILASGLGSTQGATIYLNGKPKESLLELIVRAGIREMVLPKRKYSRKIISAIQGVGLYIRYVET